MKCHVYNGKEVRMFKNPAITAYLSIFTTYLEGRVTMQP